MGNYYINMTKTFIILIIIGQFEVGLSQNNSSDVNKVYQLNHKIEIPTTLGVLAANGLALYVLKNKTSLKSDQIAALDQKNIWMIDRNAVEQTYSSTLHAKAKTASDWGMDISIFLPALLYLDKKIRKDIIDIMFLYLATQAIQGSFYTYGGVSFTNRIRPFVYYPEVSLESKFGAGAQDSFFSGHASSVAAASFFIAKVYNDYHPEIKRKKWLLYVAALIPPSYVGYQRYKALMHFPTDILTGIIVGAATGIIVPNLHKIKLGEKQNISIIPLTGGKPMLSVQLNF